MDVENATATAEDEVVTSSPVPDHAHVVVVPVANPQTALELLALAKAVVRADGGRVLAVVIVLGDADAEQNIERVDALRKVVQDVITDDEIDVELVTRPAVSIARGILDVALDEGADMILLGVQAPTPGGVAIGGVAENVIDAAHCDVLVYRRGRNGRGLEQVEGIVVAVDGSEASRVGARLGIILGHGLEQDVQVLHVRQPGATAAQAELAIERSLRDLEGGEECARTIVNATTPSKGLKTALGEQQLAVMGFNNVVRFDGAPMGATTMGALNTVRGPVIAVSRPTRDIGATAWLRRLAMRLRPRLTTVEEEALIWQSRLHATLTADFIVMCVLSSLIATFGLLLDSVAVIIGAMLVAPLMNPLIACGTTLVNGDILTLRRAGTTVGLGTLLVGGTALLVGLFLAPDIATSEMASRGSPSLIDAGVAVASGMVGAYASARKGIPAALAGVAIAAALVPPLCVFGLALPTDGLLATGAGLLFLTNIACMAVASAGVLRWLGMRVNREAITVRRRTVRGTVLLLLVVLGSLVLFGLTGDGHDLDGIASIVAEELDDAEIVDVDELGPDDAVTVTIRVPRDPPPAQVRSAIDRVEDEHDGVTLRLVVERLVGSG